MTKEKESVLSTNEWTTWTGLETSGTELGKGGSSVSAMERPGNWNGGWTTGDVDVGRTCSGKCSTAQRSAATGSTAVKQKMG